MVVCVYRSLSLSIYIYIHMYICTYRGDAAALRGGAAATPSPLAFGSPCTTYYILHTMYLSLSLYIYIYREIYYLYYVTILYYCMIVLYFGRRRRCRKPGPTCRTRGSSSGDIARCITAIWYNGICIYIYIYMISCIYITLSMLLIDTKPGPTCRTRGSSSGGAASRT